MKLQPTSSYTLHTANLWHRFKQRGNRGEVISLLVTQNCSVQLCNCLEILSAETIGKGFLLKNTTLIKMIYVISTVA